MMDRNGGVRKRMMTGPDAVPVEGNVYGKDVPGQGVPENMAQMPPQQANPGVPMAGDPGMQQDQEELMRRKYFADIMAAQQSQQNPSYSPEPEQQFMQR